MTVLITLSGRSCGAECHGAHTPTCSCVCGGRYHAVGPYEVAVALMMEDASAGRIGSDVAALVSFNSRAGSFAPPLPLAMGRLMERGGVANTSGIVYPSRDNQVISQGVRMTTEAPGAPTTVRRPRTTYPAGTILQATFKGGVYRGVVLGNTEGKVVGFAVTECPAGREASPGVPMQAAEFNSAGQAARTICGYAVTVDQFWTIVEPGEVTAVADAGEVRQHPGTGVEMHGTVAPADGSVTTLAQDGGEPAPEVEREPVEPVA